jgi:hypothetical protein
MLTIQRDTSQERKVLPDQGISKKFFLRYKVEQRFKGEADNGNIGPILMLRQNDSRPVSRKITTHLGLNPVEHGENSTCNPFGCEVDEGISFHAPVIAFTLK